MSIRNMEERILTVSSVCQIDRESSKSLLQKHGWKCDLAISGFFDGELEEIHHSKNTVKDSPLLIQKIETIEESEPSQESSSWPKNLSSFQVNCVSTVNNKFSYQVGTVLQLEPDFKQRNTHRKAQVLTKGSNEDFPARCRVYQQEGANSNQRCYIGRIDDKIGNDLAILLDLNLISAFVTVAYCPSPIRTFSILTLIAEVSVRETVFSNLFQYYSHHSMVSNSILRRAYPNAELATLCDIIGECVYYVVYFSTYCTKGEQLFHHRNYTQSVVKSMRTSFGNFDITEKKKEEKPIEIIPDSHSTGIISSIRNQLQQQQEVIELTDTLSDVEEIEILSKEDSLPLVSSEEYNASLPVVECSEGLKGLSLREYQLQALFWMLQREQGKHAEGSHITEEQNDNGMWEVHSFTDHTPYYICPLFRSVSIENPNSLYKMKGGIIADEMGLGKTITMLSLLLINRGKPYERIEDLSKQGTMDIVENASLSSCIPSNQIRHEGGSLIICPLSLLYMWQSEILNHLEPNALKCCVYHSGTFYEVCIGAKPTRITNPFHYSVVLTTYDSCFAAFTDFHQNNENWLFSTQWKRIIIDEGHIIKNDKTALHRAVVSLRGEIHWVISGTPLQNTVNDLFSLFKFLRYEPWCYKHVWDNIINSGDGKKTVSPAHTKNSHDIHINLDVDVKTNLNRLRYPLSLVMLRRTYLSKDSHGKPIVSLPEKYVQIVHLEFTKEERVFYNQVLQRTRTMFNDFVLQGIVMHQYAMILSLLLSLRQACDHPFLLLARAKGLLKRQNDEDIGKALTTQFIDQIYNSAFQTRQSVTSYAETVLKEIQEKGSLYQLTCPICCDRIGLHPVFTSCLHCFCEKCINDLAKATGFPIRCPVCRQENHRQDLLSCNYHSVEYEKVQFDAEAMWYSSTKIDYILGILDRIRNEFDLNAEKAGKQYGNILIFSQWAEMLHDIGIALTKNGMEFYQFDGSLSKKEREQILSEFETPNEENWVVFEEEVDDVEMLEEIDCSSKKRSLPKSEVPHVKKRKVTPSLYPKIMLISLRAGGVGLNLTSANTVIMCDPWWNEAVENQAINRAFRIGQKRKVMVYRLVIKDTIEEKILKLQEKKEQLIQNTLDFQNSTTIKLTIDEIKDLLQ